MGWWSSSSKISSASRLPKPKKAQDWRCDDCGELVPADAMLCEACGLDPTGCDPAIGKNLSHYEIVRRVKGGLRNVVYQAIDLSNQQVVAIKVLHARLVQEMGGRSSLHHRIQCWRQFGHPSSPRISHIFDTDSGGICWVSPWLSGVPVGGLLRKGGLPLDDVHSLITQLCEALQAYHDHGLVHGQLRPEQLFMLEGPQRKRLKLSDLGWGDLIGEHFQRSQRKDEGTFRALRYLAPEQLLPESVAVDARADVYASGGILYALLTGRHPYLGTSHDELYRQHLYDPPPRLNMACPDRRFHNQLEQIVRRAMAKQPQDRYPTMQDLGGALSGLDFTALITLRSPVAPPPEPEPPPPLLRSLPTAQQITVKLPAPELETTPSQWYIGKKHRSLWRFVLALAILLSLLYFWLS